MTLPFDSGPKLPCGAVNSLVIRFTWGIWQQEETVFCLIIAVIFIGLGRVYRLEGILKLSNGGGASQEVMGPLLWGKLIPQDTM